MPKTSFEHIGCNRQDADVFYDNWYAAGYMDEWPEDKKSRIVEIIKALKLPEIGHALDYGCGNGVFTGVLKKALPKWDIYGVDISSIAIDNAKKRYPYCDFFLSSDISLKNKKFDFLFSHHVLEHVSDIHMSWKEFDQYLNHPAVTLHVLPCGNKGSLEYEICMQRNDGFVEGLSNKFVFEDKSHLRRLTTDEMNCLAGQYGFALSLDYYANHFYGAIDWITLSSPQFILEMANFRQARNIIAALKLAFLGGVLLLIKIMRFPANTIDYKKERMKKYKYYSLAAMLLILYPFSKLANIYLKRMSEAEWRKKKRNKNGSEMYLYYKRIHSING